MRMVKIRLREGISRDTAEYLINLHSWLLYKPEIETHKICYNAKSEHCKKCEEPECNYTGLVFKEKRKE